MKNTELYDRVRAAPQEALRTIKGGRINGFTDINPMWRIQTLTELFGPCGFGWKYTLDKLWTESGANGEISAFANISLYIKINDDWSEAIPGTGGSAFVTREKNGLYTSDECYKMAVTDAISVACKSIGMAADIYWSEGRTKYDLKHVDPLVLCEDCGEPVRPFRKGGKVIKNVEEMVEGSKENYGKVLCIQCMRLRDESETENGSYANGLRHEDAGDRV